MEGLCSQRWADKISLFREGILKMLSLPQLITENDIPSEVREKLGKKNGEIIDSFVIDLIEWSKQKGEIRIF